MNISSKYSRESPQNFVGNKLRNFSRMSLTNFFTILSGNFSIDIISNYSWHSLRNSWSDLKIIVYQNSSSDFVINSSSVSSTGFLRDASRVSFGKSLGSPLGFIHELFQKIVRWKNSLKKSKKYTWTKWWNFWSNF